MPTSRSARCRAAIRIAGERRLDGFGRTGIRPDA